MVLETVRKDDEASVGGKAGLSKKVVSKPVLGARWNLS